MYFNMFDLRTASPALSLPIVIRALRVAVAAWGGRRLIEGVLVLLLHRRLGEVCGRLERLMARFAAGLPMRLGVRAVVCSPGSGVPGVRLWPRRFGWLCAAAAHEAAGFGEQIRAVLAHPDMVALLAAAPQAGRLLRPVCRALGIETAALGIARVERVKKAAKAPAPAKPEISRIPLPRGVLTAARRQISRKRSEA